MEAAAHFAAHFAELREGASLEQFHKAYVEPVPLAA